MVRANNDRIDRERLRALGTEVWEVGGTEILEFVEQTLTDKPFAIKKQQRGFVLGASFVVPVLTGACLSLFAEVTLAAVGCFVPSVL